MFLTAVAFSTLTTLQQLEIIFESAVIVGERKDDELKYVLYNVHGLYVEEMRDLNYSDCYYYTPIEDTDLLMPYTDDIQVVFL